MKISITTRNVKLTKPLEDYVTKKIEKLTHFLMHQIINAQVKMEVEKYRQIVEIKLHVEGHIFKAKEVSSDMYAAVDLTTDKLERQVNKFKEIQKGHHSKHPAKQEIYRMSDGSAPQDILGTRKQDLKYFTPKQALNEMDALELNFFAFSNRYTDKVTIVYKKENGGNGLLELNY
ncbi:MAG: ribosome-associated translation inhibitor RaiA [Elusimicrobia bacterium]|nr:ribosome-associated translation inhibitor RaiA [Elusimicrobiota bacterium]MBU2615263.1 ribosome-associated translation inhibitor RaiA [Elusimicrobiota bacterium]